MKGTERIPIVRKNGITIYGRIIGTGGKLGQFEVYTPFSTNDLTTYTTFKEAERKFDELDAIAEKQGSEGLRLHFRR